MSGGWKVKFQSCKTFDLLKNEREFRSSEILSHDYFPIKQTTNDSKDLNDKKRLSVKCVTLFIH
jgi:hypothetical protein